MKALKALSIGRSINRALLLSALLVALAAGCAGHSTAPLGLSPGAGQPDPTPVQGLTDAGGRPLLPPTGYVPANAKYHQISAAQVGINGIDCSIQAGANNYALPDDHALVIEPGGEDDLLAYAMYALTGLNTERPVETGFSVTSAPIQPGGEEDLPLSFWVGISDFTTYSWEWHGPYTSPDDVVNLDLNELVGGQDIRDRYISAANVLYMVVLTEAGAEFVGPGNPLGLTAARVNLLTIDKLTVGELGYRSTRPHFPLIESIGVGGAAASSAKQAAALDPSQYVTLTWTHVFDVNDPDSEAIQYKIYRKGPDDASMIPIGSVNAPEQQYIDPTNNASWVPEVVPGATYTYYLRAYNNAGFTPFSSAEYVIPLLPPANLQASDGEFMDKIVLTWTKAEGATGYKIYRDGQAETDVIATLGDVATYDDTGVTDFDPHTYWVRGTYPDLPDGGAFSASDTGFLQQGLPALAADTLYAIPQTATVHVGDPVTIVVATGQPAHTLFFLSGVGLTVENAGTYVANSYNYGKPGGFRTDTDGYWALMLPPPANNEYLDPPDAFLATPQDIGGGFHRYSFGIYPLGDHATPADIGDGAELFNFQMTFSMPGVYHLGFQLNDGVTDQTYYSDAADANKYYWATLDSSYTVTVEAETPPDRTAVGYVLDGSGVGSPDVVMTFTGGLASVTTDAAGFWSRDSIPDGTYTVTPSKSGSTFTPTDREFTINTAGVVVGDFTEEGPPASEFILFQRAITYFDAGSFTLKLRIIPNGAAGFYVQVYTDDAVNMKAYAFSILYDETKYNCDDQALNINDLGYPGVLSLPPWGYAGHPDFPASGYVEFAACAQGLGADDGLDGVADLVQIQFSYGAEDAGPLAFQVPDSLVESVSDLQLSGIPLTWHYPIFGDCDQNGLVNSMDVIPIGVHYSELPSPPDWASPARSADADSNGEVNVGDLTPITQRWGTYITEWKAYGSDNAADYPAGPLDPNGAGSVWLGTELFSDAIGDPTAGVLQFESFISDTGAYLWVRPNDGTADGIASNMVTR